MANTLARLEATILSRREADEDGSYVARLFAKGRPLQARKLGEEAIELVVASLAQDHAAITDVSAFMEQWVVYHDGSSRTSRCDVFSSVKTEYANIANSAQSLTIIFR